MSIIQKPKRISSESLGSNESKEAVNAVGSSINGYLEESYDAIMGGLTVNDNLDQEFKELTVTVDANGIPKTPLKFTTELVRVNGMICIRAFLAQVTSMPFVGYIQNSNIITITNITGLTADTKYKLVLLLIGG